MDRIAIGTGSGALQQSPSWRRHCSASSLSPASPRLTDSDRIDNSPNGPRYDACASAQLDEALDDFPQPRITRPLHSPTSHARLQRHYLEAARFAMENAKSCAIARNEPADATHAQKILNLIDERPVAGLPTRVRPICVSKRGVSFPVAALAHPNFPTWFRGVVAQAGSGGVVTVTRNGFLGIDD